MDGAPPYDVTQFELCRYASLALLALLVFGWIRHSQRFLSVLSPGQARLLFGALVAGVVLRFAWPELAVFHENGHGYRYIGMAIAPESDLHAYGSGYAAFFNLFFTFLPHITDVVLVINAALGALTVLFAGLFGARVLGGSAGVGMAWALAVLPVHIKLSGTESPFVLALFLAAVALWAVAELRTEGGFLMACIAGLATGLAPQSRPLMLIVPLYVLLFGCFCRPHFKQWMRERTTWCFVGFATVLLTLHVHWLLELHGSGGRLSGYGQFLELGPERVWESMTQRGLLLNPNFTPLHFLVLAALGAYVAWKKAPRVALLLVAGTVGLIWLYGARANHYSEALRFSVAPQVMLALLVGPALAKLTEWMAGGKNVRWPQLLLPGLLLAAALLSHKAITTETVDTLESRFLRSSYASLPQQCALVIPPARAGRGRIENSFPFFEYRERLPGNDNYNWGLSRVDQPMLEGLRKNNPCVLYYRGLMCSTFIPEEPMSATLRPECAAFERQVSMKPVVSVTVEGRTLPRHLHAHPNRPFEMAFFQLDPIQSQISAGVQ